MTKHMGLLQKKHSISSIFLIFGDARPRVRFVFELSSAHAEFSF
jgi:hypothetical protein